ncbi:hypothetical protein [Parasitella parasitica]|uniref:Uncharacterized protein n=1 Tax=Parasitella parasitica TaxID=35722 RepID=A0A0B7N446_9FUNG|nr:hypothetical protein [Parasitella parasitica]
MFRNAPKDVNPQPNKLLKKKDHSRSHSSVSASTSAAQNTNNNDTFKLNDANSRGWLESTGVQVNPSRSVDKKPHRRKQSKELSQKGAVSVEDIYTLTEMTTKLPKVTPQATTSKNKHKARDHQRQTSEPSSSTQRPLELSTSLPTTGTAPLEIPIITTSSDLITSSSSKSSLSSSLDLGQEHRRSWLHGKKKDSSKSPAASIVDEFYQKNPKEDKALSRIHSINITSLSDLKLGHKKVPHQQKESDNLQLANQTYLLDDLDDKQERKHEASGDIFFEEANDDSHETRSDIFMTISSDEDQDEEEEDQNHAAPKKLRQQEGQPEAPSEVQADEEKEQTIIMNFDYFTLPTEVKGLIDAYQHKGKVERKRMVVKYRQESTSANTSDVSSSVMQEDDDEDYDDDDDEEDDDAEDGSNRKNIVYYRDLIVGEKEKINYKSNPVRDIAILTTTRLDNIEFIKLIQLPSEEPLDQGPLLDLHVSLFGDPNNDADMIAEAEEFDTMLHDIESKLVLLDGFKKESRSFLQDHISTMESLNLYQHHENEIPKLPRTHSQPSLIGSAQKPNTIPYLSSTSSGSSFTSTNSFSSSSSSSSGVILRPTREMLSHKNSYNRHSQSMYIDHTAVKSRDPFTYRQEEIGYLIKSLKSELVEFKSSLLNTEDLVADVQVDMKDFRARMETYIKDIPESHYSALKRLEVDVESILSKRAKNPWMDTGYALLSYLLTVFALGVWIVIYIAKWSKKVLMFPRKLWGDYSSYLVERNKVVKKASLLSVTSGKSTSLFEENDDQIRQRSAAK